MSAAISLFFAITCSAVTTWALNEGMWGAAILNAGSALANGLHLYDMAVANEPR